jgi:hypothetical protein
MDLLLLNLTSGISYGALQVAKAICMRVLMSIKKSTIFHKVMKLQEKIDYVLT